jgi:hypothetical protein
VEFGMGGPGAPLASRARDPYAEWLAERDRYRRACGCKEGGIAAVAVLVAAIAWQAASFGALSLQSILRALGLTLATVVLGAFTGKLLGLAYARARFYRSTRRLLASGSAPLIMRRRSGTAGRSTHLIQETPHGPVRRRESRTRQSP